MKYGLWAAIVVAAFAGCAEDNEANIPQMDNSIAVPADGQAGGGGPRGMGGSGDRPPGYPAPISRSEAASPDDAAVEDEPASDEPASDEPAPDDSPADEPSPE